LATSEKVLDTIFRYVTSGKSININLKEYKKRELMRIIKEYILKKRCPICGKRFSSVRAVSMHIKKNMHCRAALREWIRSIMASSGD